MIDRRNDQVVPVTTADNQVFARKLIRPFGGSVDHDTIANEVRAIEDVCTKSHPNIIAVFRHGLLRPQHSVYFIDMELCSTEKF